jgi:sodium transport system permease protein
MNAIVAVCRKEILDNVRDRRTMFSTLAFGPIFAPVMFAVMIQLSVERAISSGEERLVVPTIGIEAAPNLEEFLAARDIETDAEHGLSDLESAAAAVRNGRLPYALVIDESFVDDFAGPSAARITIVLDRSDSRDTERVQRVQAAIGAYSDRVAMSRRRPVAPRSSSASSPTSCCSPCSWAACISRSIPRRASASGAPSSPC